MTCLVATFDLTACTVTYTNAGHPSGIVAGRAAIRRLDRGGPPAGLLQKSAFHQERLQLQIGDVCVLVSDGITEALERDAPLECVLGSSLDCRGGRSADELCEMVMARALAGTGPAGTGPAGVQEWNDDRTVVVVKVCERPARAAATGDSSRETHATLSRFEGSTIAT